MGTKNEPGAFDCYANAEPDEPMFVLLGRDRHAGLMVKLWAIIRHHEGEDEAKVAEALACAEDMNRFALRRGHDVIRIEGLYERVAIALTEGMDAHPEDYDGPCACDICQSCDSGRPG